MEALYNLKLITHYHLFLCFLNELQWTTYYFSLVLHNTIVGSKGDGIYQI